MLELAEECLASGRTERPEKRWMEQVYDRFRAENGQLGKAEADQLIFREMYAAEPEKGSDTLKIRYWRTGRHLPVSREQCLLFGKALQLSEEERRFLIQGYCDRCDRVFESVTQDAAYQERRALLQELAGEYLDKVHPALKRQLYHSGEDLAHSLRHLYYTDAKGYIRCREGEYSAQVGRHISSLNYMSEFGRQMKLLGEIPRKTMIRHLMIFASPFVNEEWLRYGTGEVFAEKTMDQELTEFAADLMTDEEDSFRRRLIRALSKLSVEQWEVLEQIAKDLAQKK